jgi:hypothetical protein
MTDRERDILRLMYDLQIELVRHQGDQIDGLKHAIDGATKAIESLERSHADRRQTHDGNRRLDED